MVASQNNTGLEKLQESLSKALVELETVEGYIRECNSPTPTDNKCSHRDPGRYS